MYVLLVHSIMLPPSNYLISERGSKGIATNMSVPGLYFGYTREFALPVITAFEKL